MRGIKLATIGAMAAAAIALAGPAQAVPPPTPTVGGDYDASFKNTVNGFGIYSPQDYLAWLGKISCDRLQRGVDHDAYQSANFIQHNLPRGTSQGQAFQFLGAAVDHYCPDQVGVVQQAGAH